MAHPTAHRVLAAGSTLCVVGALLGGCAKAAQPDSQAGGSPERPPGSDSAAAPPDETVTVRIRNGEIVNDVPTRMEIGQGDMVRIVVRSDAPDTVHVHGYDTEKPVAPGRPATLRIRADQTGLFEVETHEGGLLLFQLVVR